MNKINSTIWLSIFVKIKPIWLRAPGQHKFRFFQVIAVSFTGSKPVAFLSPKSFSDLQILRYSKVKISDKQSRKGVKTVLMEGFEMNLAIGFLVIREITSKIHDDFFVISKNSCSFYQSSFVI